MNLRALCLLGFAVSLFVGCPPSRQTEEQGLQIDSTPTPVSKALVDVHLLMNKSSAEIEQLLGKPISVRNGNMPWQGCTEENQCKEVWYSEKYQIYYILTKNGQRTFIVDYVRPFPLQKKSLSLIGVQPVEPSKIDTETIPVWTWENIPEFDEIRLQQGATLSVKRWPR